MPELPEVETVKNVLIPIIKGQKIIKIDVLRASIISGNPETFINYLTNETFLDVDRIGKYLIIKLTNDKVLVSHLRMEGKYFDYLEEEKNSKYARVIFHLSNGHKLIYDDSRTFGKMIISDINNYRNIKELSKLGPEPFNADYKKIYQLVKNKNNPIKVTLLDQTVLTGLGNIYVDEVLFLSKINPCTLTKDITLKQWDEIIKNAKKVLLKAIDAGGSTIRSYHPGKGIDGNFQVQLLAYGKKDSPCPNCGHLFRFKKVGGRGTTYCSTCQPYIGKNIKVAIYGKMGSGKSTALNVFKTNNIPTISADDIVISLYQKIEVIQKINAMFSLNFVDKVNKDVLRQYLLSHPQDIKKLNRYIHPLVKKETERFLLEHKQGLVVSEVPLLFEGKMDHLFDVLIYINIDENAQNTHLDIRNNDQEKQTKVFNDKIDQKEKYADFVVNNNKDKAYLEKQIIDIINKLQGRLN